MGAHLRSFGKDVGGGEGGRTAPTLYLQSWFESLKNGKEGSLTVPLGSEIHKEKLHVALSRYTVFINAIRPMKTHTTYIKKWF